MELPMDRFESMSTFVAVVDAGGFSAASRRLRMPLPTVSRKVSELEDKLGVRLLNRTTRQVTLTDSGRAFLESCRRILDDLGQAERVAAGEFTVPQGELIITAPIVFGRLHVLPIVTEFLKAFAKVDARLQLADRVVDLLEEQVDVAVRIGELPDSSMVATKVGDIRYVVCASPAYLAARGEPRHPKDLAVHDSVAFTALGSTTEWNFHMGEVLRVFPIRARLVVTTAEAAIDAAVAGMGVTRLLCYQAAQAVSEGKLKILLRDYGPKPIPVSLVHAGGRLMPVKLRAFLDFAAPRLKSRLRPLTKPA
jgi:DNA-binding transcriptional LysR family regulator